MSCKVRAIELEVGDVLMVLVTAGRFAFLLVAQLYILSEQRQYRK